MANTLKSRFAQGLVACAVAMAAVFALPFGTADATDVKVGAIGFVAPKYEGSDEYRVLGVPQRGGPGEPRAGGDGPR